MKPRLRPILTITAMVTAVAGAASARDSGHGLPSPQFTPELVVGRGVASDFSAIIHRNRHGRITSVTRGGVTQNYTRGPGGRIDAATSNVAGAPAFSYTQHDAHGRRTQVTTNKGTWTEPLPGGWTVLGDF